jgi:hypothetical protein
MDIASTRERVATVVSDVSASLPMCHVLVAVRDLEPDDKRGVLGLFTVEGAGDDGELFSSPLETVRMKMHEACFEREGFNNDEVPQMLQWAQLGRGNLTLDFERLGRAARYYADRRTR